MIFAGDLWHNWFRDAADGPQLRVQ